MISGLVLFLGGHSVRIYGGDWRETQIARLGEIPWKGVYSLVSTVALGLIICAYGMACAESPVLWTMPLWTRHLAALLTLPVFILLVATYLPGSHIKAVVDHPVVAGVKIWSGPFAGQRKPLRCDAVRYFPDLGGARLYFRATRWRW